MQQVRGTGLLIRVQAGNTGFVLLDRFDHSVVKLSGSLE
jgi:hypothetical protein